MPELPPPPPPPPPRRRRAVGLKYSGEGAPRVAAKGQGLVADRIVELAEANGVPVRHDPALVTALATLELGAEIGDELFVAVAECLAWAYSITPKG